ncbi:hypothetical protein BC826DRAFT_1104398 [Russula brevipes]|nr:hypothetical protein BC826DRAFT_1104398 [Russula brevipes]
MAWNIDYEHDSEEVILLKRHISEQDNRYSTLQSQLLKTKAALDDNNVALDETTGKLRLEADRALHLDEELQECRETLDKEKFMRHNADLALRSAGEREKQEELTRRELQQALESISSRDTASNAIISNLRNEKVALERRMRELEANLQQVITAATPKRRGRVRSSSLSDVRITTLERDLGDSQASETGLRAELARAQEKLRRTEDDLCRIENDRTQGRGDHALVGRGGEDAGLAQEREEELIRRVEEEEAKVLAMERLLSETRNLKAIEGALQKAERRLAAEISKVKGLEERNTGLNRDVKRVQGALEGTRSQAQDLKTALDDRTSLLQSLQAEERALRAQLNSQQQTIRSLKNSESNVSTSSAPSENGCVGANTDVETMEKLLAAVDRLRSERDDLRRQLEFLKMESKFAIEALERKINSAPAFTTTAEDPRVSQLQATDSSHLGLIASASLVMVGHLQTRVDHHIELKDQAHAEISHLRSQLQDAVTSHDDSLRATHGIQQSVLDMRNHLHDTEQQRDDLLLQVQHFQSQVAAATHVREQCRELQSNLEGATTRLSEVTKALEDAESERNSLKVEVVNLQDEMALAQKELKQAERRYSDLQNQQLSSMSSTQVNHKLKEQIEELEGRVARRTEQIGIHQHDIKRLEANLKLQEDRIAEMTNELEVATSEKESMVEDCADAREARDRALKKVEDLEDAVATLETQLQALEEQRDVEHVVFVVSFIRWAPSEQTRNKDSSKLPQSTAIPRTSEQTGFGAPVGPGSAVAHREEAREAVVALAVVQTANAKSRRTMLHDRDQICALLSATRDELNNRFEEISSLQDQLRRMRSQADAESTEQQSARSVEFAKLQQANTDLDRLRAELEDELAQSRKELGLAFEQRDQLRIDSVAIREQIVQLQSDHAEELESLRGKLQQVAVDLQETREAHAAAEKASSELSTANAELESRLETILQQQDTDSELIAELQSREAGHTKQALDVQSRLKKAMEELQQATCEKSEVEILLQQTKEELCKAKDATEGRVSELLEERDALQKSLDEAESRHSKEMGRLRERLRDLEADDDSLRAQLDKAITDQKRVRATFETELRESAERCEASRAQLDDVKAQLSALEAEFDGMEDRLQNSLEEKDALEAKNTNLESEIQRAFSMQRYLESQLKDSAHESAAVKAELEQVKGNYARAERDGKAAEMQLTFHAAQHDQAVASLKREIQLLHAASRPDERIEELEEKISHMDQLMRSKTQEIEENDDRFIELHKEKKKLTAKVETLNRKVQTLQSKLATLKDAAASRNPTQPTASTSKQKSPVTQQPPVAAPAQYTRKSISVPAAPSTPPSHSRATSGPSRLLGRTTPESRPVSSVFRAKTPEPAKAPAPRLQDPIPVGTVAGKKRAAPDDGDEPVPVQGFTSEGVLVTERATVTTPRRRKSPRTGFTPVRNTTAHPLTTLAPEPPPAQTAHHGAPPIIFDVTNSPRSQPQTDAKVKRSWLGTHRSKVTQSSGNATARTTLAWAGPAQERFR